MNYEDISDILILNYQTLKIAIYEEVKPLFKERTHILTKWEKLAYQMTPQEVYNQRPTEEMGSFGILYSLFSEVFFPKKPITKANVREAVATYPDVIKGGLTSHLYQEFPDKEAKYSVNQTKIEEAIEKDYILSSTDIDFHLMRDMVTKKKEFKEAETGYLVTEIVDNRGNVKGLAELRPHEIENAISTEQQIWLETLGETLNSLDELTADLFDLISYLWLTSPRSTDGYIEFHSNDALELRNIKRRNNGGKESEFREEDRFNIMRRVAALSSIWVSLGDEKIKILNAEEINENELYKYKDFQKMFEIGKVRVAYDKVTGEAKGIYAVQVRPTSILTPFLEGPKRSLGALDLKAIQYHPIKCRPHKRLTRYLNLQWKIRSVKRNYLQPFKVATLLKEVDLSDRYTWSKKRDILEETLDDLKKDEVIKNWRYKEGIDEEKVGKKNWYNEYWLKLPVEITPADWILKENSKNLILPAPPKMNSVITIEHSEIVEMESQDSAKKNRTGKLKTIQKPDEVHEQQSFDFAIQGITLSPESMKETLERTGLSIRQAAEEIGVAHTTLSRYIKRENKRPNKKNDEKMLAWLKEKNSIAVVS